MRQADASDLRAVQEVIRAAFAIYVDRIGREPAPMTVNYAAMIERQQVWVATRATRTVGVIVLVPASDYLWIETLAVHPIEQNRGIASDLLGLADEQARDHALAFVRLCTNEAMTETIDFYLRRGYSITRREVQDGFQRVFFQRRA